MPAFEVARMGHPVLRKKAEPVDLERLKAHGDNELQRFIDNMIDTMHAEEGVGLAAPQVNRSLQIVVLECERNERYPGRPDFELLVLVNPEITFYGEEQISGWEACLSLPNLRGWVPRSRQVTVTAADRLGNPVTIEAEDFMAVVLQHEIDHLNGILYIDRMTDMSRLAFQKEYEDFWMPAAENNKTELQASRVE